VTDVRERLKVAWRGMGAWRWLWLALILVCLILTWQETQR
jgi:hypothetical protein